MKGNNELILNEASMIVAVQEYLNKRITLDTPKVVTIWPARDGLANLFTIKLEEPDENKPNA